MAIRRFSTDDVDAYRRIRLEALQADPGAFGSSYEREVAFDDETWRSRLEGVDGRAAAIFCDELDGEIVATAGIAYTEHDPNPMLVGMWVRPAARGAGSGRRLVAAAVDWARGRNAPEVILWVVRDNESAIKLYESCGFRPTGTVDTLPSNPCAEELEMRMSLA